MSSTDDRIITFYRRWHLLERSLGSRGGLVIDFDMLPAQSDLTPFADRWEVLQALDALRSIVAAADDLHDPAYLLARMRGSDAYLRSLLGQRIAFSDYVHRTMGFTPSRTPSDTLQAMGEALREDFDQVGIPWGPEGRVRWSKRIGRRDVSGLGQDLRAAAVAWVDALRSWVPGIVAPAYGIEVVEEDAYWSNWIDGNAEDGVTLRINLHPRIEYHRFSHIGLAAHEIAGHAVHVTSLCTAVREGRMDRSVLLLTVHALDAFHMEGIAQSVGRLVPSPFERAPEQHLLGRYRAYASAHLDNAQLDLEDGQPIDALLSTLQTACPLSKPLTMRSSLRDRSRNPMLRSYIHVYGQSRRTFLRACELSDAPRRAFVAEMITGLKTADEIRARLDAAGA